MQKHLRGNTGGRPELKTTTQRLADRIRKAAPETAETYHAYGATEHFFNTIDELVGYDVPQVKTKEEVPKLEGGEELGVATGEGEWYRGTLVASYWCRSKVLQGVRTNDVDYRAQPESHV
jgi:hypothetical protein